MGGPLGLVHLAPLGRPQSDRNPWCHADSLFLLDLFTRLRRRRLSSRALDRSFDENQFDFVFAHSF